VTSAYRFGRFELQPARRQLLADGHALALGQRAFDVLQALLERHERLVTKNELLDVVWPGVVVEENNLQVQISTLRKLLGPQAIATIPGRGYRFTAALDGANDARVSDSGAAAAPPQVRSAPSTNLPGELPLLYGREAEVSALSTLILTQRLVTVVGAGGIGKSRLAQAVAHALLGRWPDGVWMVELAGLSDATLIPNAIARALDVRFADQGAARDGLIAGMAPRHALLVLDNCEHLLDAIASLAQDLLQAAPQLTLLATSQEPLRLPAEQQYRVTPLAVPEQAAIEHAREFGAVALFDARVRATDPRFALNDESLALAIDICRRLDGLPLAIELAAARVATLGLRPVRDKLDARFKLLTGGSRSMLRRHQTLRAALEWSHNLLDEDERAVFRRLGVFAGGFTIELAQAVAGDTQLDEWAVLDHLSALVEKSLVVADAGDAPRYRLLESARAFALEQLADHETAPTLARHAHALRDFLQRVDDTNLDGELRTDQYAARVLPELDNLRAAYAWAAGEGGDPQVAVALAAHAGSLIDYAVECAQWLIPLQPYVEAGGVDDALAARYWRAIAAGNMAGRVPMVLQAEAAERARAGYAALGHPRRVFSSLIRLSQSCGVLGDLAGEQAALDEARALLRADWPGEFWIMLRRREAWAARCAGRLSEALALDREAVRISASIGDWRLQVGARNNLIDLLWQMGPLEEAAREICSLLDELRARPSAHSDMDVVYSNAIGILAEMGRVDEASRLAREGLPIMRRSRNYFIEEWVYLFWRRGQHAVAARLVGAANATRARTELPVQENERRLMNAARAGLAAALPAAELANHIAAGALLDEPGMAQLIAEALA
jgi:predicted ATPase/DNA-binding winged helix-turn-helix (wHTH) protein